MQSTYFYRKRAMGAIALAALAVAGTLSLNGIKTDKTVEPAVYSITKTAAPQVKVLFGETTDASSETYFTKQWALENDGTFVLDTKGSNGENLNNGGYYNPGGFFRIGPGNGSRGIGFRGMFGNIIGNGKNQRSRAYAATTQSSNTAAVSDVDIDAVKAWQTVGNSGRQVIVAVIDTGVDYTHEDLADAIWVNSAETPGDGIDNDGNGYIDDVYGWDFYNNKAYTYNSRNSSEYDHGTHCAGTIAAEINGTGIAGIASNGNIKVMTIKALGGREGSGETDGIIKAIQYAEKMGASICNFSFGTSTYDENLKKAIADSDMLFVCASGNGDETGKGTDNDSTPVYPASFDLDNIISVANLTYDGTLDASSNYGSKSVDVAAPGTDILSTVAGSRYGYLSGSSMAAPMVTGVAALTYSYDKSASLSEVKDIVLSSVKKLDTLKGKVATQGMVDAYNAVSEAAK